MGLKQNLQRHEAVTLGVGWETTWNSVSFGDVAVRRGEQQKMPAANGHKKSAQSLTRRLKLHYMNREQLTVERRRAGEEGYTYHRANGTQITDEVSLRRFASLAVPPAYEDV